MDNLKNEAYQMKIPQGRKWQEGEDWFVSPQKYASLFSSFFNRSEARPKVPTIYLYCNPNQLNAYFELIQANFTYFKYALVFELVEKIKSL